MVNQAKSEGKLQSFTHHVSTIYCGILFIFKIPMRVSRIIIGYIYYIHSVKYWLWLRKLSETANIMNHGIS